MWFATAKILALDLTSVIHYGIIVIGMKTNYLFITVLILIFCSCKQNENSSGNDLTTVDSNVVGADSNSAILHLDNAKNDTNFPVAMD